MPKFRIICKGCNTVHGFADKSVIEGLSPKCSSCGLERIAIEPVLDEIISQMDFDLFITNKGTAASVHNGFVLNIEDLKGKKEDEIRNVFIERAAKALAAIIDNAENNKRLLDNGHGGIQQ